MGVYVIMKLKVWHIPQVPMIPFEVKVNTVQEGAKVMDILGMYDLFLYEHDIRPDYANASGLVMFDPDDKENGPEGSWVCWCDEDTGEDDPHQWVEDRV